MAITFNELVEFHQPVFRNIQGVSLPFDEFDDLSVESSAQSFAHRISSPSQAKWTFDKLQYHAIDFIFTRKSWLPTRFGNGTFPLWYGGVELKTTFYETLYHWKKTYLDSPQGFLQSMDNKVIETVRTVFTVDCNAALIDLRKKADQDDKLIHPETKMYPYTQQIGLRVYQEGYPGLITKSARDKAGENLVVFKKEILSAPEHYHNYIYEYDLNEQRSLVKEFDSKSTLLEIGGNL
jgi:hypothetical protein